MRSCALPVVVVCALGATTANAQSPVTVINYSNYAVSGLPATVATAAPVAPGSIATAYGSFGSAPEAGASAQSLTPLPTELAGIKVRVGGADAPLYFVGRNQINLVVPSVANGRQAVEVSAGGSVVARGSVLVYDWGPALATSNALTRQAIVQNQDFSINSQSAPARRGEIIQVYATGCGATNPALPAGSPPPQGTLARAVAEVGVLMGAQQAAVQFAGAHPQFPGICQVNAVVPNAPFLSGRVPLQISVNGLPSNPLLIWVQ